ncbi:hypothetical protein [Anaerotalea alkaliphila]|uniref:Uncharacterized protein n=1 Tax=Anaerotalea alkaliphila TaxID=2662126 RepID=A0A7X5KP07_9FIRM|nr:hypothetical protein [Anaerotalea alkaliphila]NDL68504.1 hypothetical protein [Anaerotalea alkaliphila]
MPSVRTKEFALYKGEEMLGIGTIDELAEMQGVKPETIRFYLYPAYQRRVRNAKNRMVLVRLDQEDE